MPRKSIPARKPATKTVMPNTKKPPMKPFSKSTTHTDYPNEYCRPFQILLCGSLYLREQKPLFLRLLALQAFLIDSRNFDFQRRNAQFIAAERTSSSEVLKNSLQVSLLFI
jgi:hypothetical protein